jgi:hypothetical protein
MRRRIEAFLFDQPNVDFRVFVARVGLALTVVSYVIVGPFSRFHADAAALLYRPVGPFSFIPAMGPMTFAALKGMVIVSGIAFAIGFWTRLSCIAFALSYFVLAFYVGHFSTQLFSYMTHANFFTLILCFVDTERFWSVDRLLDPARRARPMDPARRQLASFALAFMQLYVVAFYMQAGLAKLLVGGVDWFITGATPYYAAILTGTRVGLWLTQHRWIFNGIGLFTGFFEIGFFLILWRPMRRLFAVAVIAFHFGILLNLNIFFYQLSAFVPLLFIFDETRRYRRAVVGLAVYALAVFALMSLTPLASQPLGTSMPAYVPALGGP